MRALAFILLLATPPAAAQVRVIDGDTLALGGEIVRLHALDCPELGQPGGYDAALALAAMLRGKAVVLQRIGKDRHGRTVARVIAGGEDATCAMIRTRLCRRYERYDRAGRYRSCVAG